jgi:hypothetical protein
MALGGYTCANSHNHFRLLLAVCCMGTGVGAVGLPRVPGVARRQGQAR